MTQMRTLSISKRCNDVNDAGEIDLHSVELFTFRNSEFRHKHDFYMHQHGKFKHTESAPTHDWDRIWK